MNFYNSVKLDLFRYSGDTSTTSLIHHFRYSPGFRYIFFLRMIQQSRKFSFKGIIGSLFYKRLTTKYGYQIPKTVKIGRGFLIMHFGHLVINSKAVIGDNCNIYHGVTIGATFRGKNEGIPVIGNKVWIGAGAAIVGGITIGDNVLIAPNSFVNFSVPANCIVIGNPATIIPSENATLAYIYNIV